VLTPEIRQVNTETQSDTSPLQIWEGRVLCIDHENKSMEVRLSAKMAQMPDHTGEISLEWVSEQDMDLVRPGAVFYLSLYKRLLGPHRGTVENAQELRFRRQPNWTKNQLKQVDIDAQMLLSKVRSSPVVE